MAGGAVRKWDPPATVSSASSSGCDAPCQGRKPARRPAAPFPATRRRSGYGSGFGLGGWVPMIEALTLEWLGPSARAASGMLRRGPGTAVGRSRGVRDAVPALDSDDPAVALSVSRGLSPGDVLAEFELVGVQRLASVVPVPSGPAARGACPVRSRLACATTPLWRGASPRSPSSSPSAARVRAGSASRSSASPPVANTS